jgi:hypothetical protein
MKNYDTFEPRMVKFLAAGFAFIFVFYNVLSAALHHAFYVRRHGRSGSWRYTAPLARLHLGVRLLASDCESPRSEHEAPAHASGCLLSVRAERASACVYPAIARV